MAQTLTLVEEILRALADACAYIHATIPVRIINVMRMQAMLYYDMRGRFGLSSNLVQQAFRRVAANRKMARAQGEAVTTFEHTLYTSQMCHGCLHMGSRTGKRFACAHCIWTGDAYFNAAKHIKILGPQVTQPCSPWVHCHLLGS